MTQPSRFYILEHRGYMDVGSSVEGIEVMVLDRDDDHRVVFSKNTSMDGWWRTAARCRAAAETKLAELEEWERSVQAHD